MQSIVKLGLLLGALGLLSACGGSKNTPTPVPPVSSFVVTATASEGGSINPSSQSVVPGGVATFILTADADYELAYAQGCNGSLSGDQYTTAPVEASCTVLASFNRLQKMVVSVSAEISEQLTDGKEYNLVSGLDALAYSQGVDGELTMAKGLGDSELLILTSDIGEPIAIGLRMPGENNAVVSLESSAIVFVLRDERFFGVNFASLAEVSESIKAHAKFQSLMDEIQQKIESDSPCPMSPQCSFVASLIAEEIAADLDVIVLETVAEGGR